MTILVERTGITLRDIVIASLMLNREERHYSYDKVSKFWIGYMYGAYPQIHVRGYNKIHSECNIVPPFKIPNYSILTHSRVCKYRVTIDYEIIRSRRGNKYDMTYITAVTDLYTLVSNFKTNIEKKAWAIAYVYREKLQSLNPEFFVIPTVFSTKSSKLYTSYHPAWVFVKPEVIDKIVGALESELRGVVEPVLS